MTIRPLLTSTMPVAGIVVALFAAAASVSATVLTAAVLSIRYGPLHAGLLYLPEVAGAIITAVLLGKLITRRSLHYLPLAGMGFLAAGIAVFCIEVPSSQGATLIASRSPVSVSAQRSHRPYSSPASRWRRPACSGCSRSSSYCERWRRS